MNKLDSSDKKVLLMWGVVGLVAVCLILFINIKLGVIDINKIFKDKYKIVTDGSRHSTVNGTLVKYYSFINNKDYDAVITILNNDYLIKNNIDKNNVNSILTESDKALTFNSRIMCSKKISNNEVSYLVSGFESESNTGKRLNTKYYEVILDSNDFHFSIKPTSEKVYKGECYEK